MNKTWRTISRLAAIVLLALISAYSSSQEQTPIPSKKEMILLRAARTPADHKRIAEYYQSQADLLTASSRDHITAAVAYDQGVTHPAMAPKHWAIRFNRPSNHCRAYSKSDMRKARKAEALAELYEQMAEAAEQKRP